MFVDYEKHKTSFENANQKAQELLEKRGNITANLKDLSEDISKALTKLERTENSLCQAQTDLNVEKKKLKVSVDASKIVNDKAKDYENEIREIERKIKKLEEELSGELDGSTQEQLDEMEAVMNEKNSLGKNMKKQFDKKREVETKKAAMVNELENKIRKSLYSINEKLESSTDLSLLQKQLVVLSDQRKSLKETANITQTAYTKNEEIVKSLREELDKITTNCDRLEADVWNKKNGYENYMAKYYRPESKKESTLLEQLKVHDYFVPLVLEFYRVVGRKVPISFSLYYSGEKFTPYMLDTHIPKLNFMLKNL